MDISTHSTASSQSQSQLPGGGAPTAPSATMAAPPQPPSSAASTSSNGNDSTTPAAAAASAATGGANVVVVRKPQAPSREQAQLLKLREANAKYKNLLKLAKERIQEQEGLLEERQGT